MPKSNNPFMPGTPSQMPTAAAGAAPMPGNFTSGSADTFEVDMTAVETGNGFTIPEGNYKARLADVEQSVSKGGNPMFVWTFEISEGPHKGFVLKSFTALTPAAMWKVAETVEALGIGQTGTVVKFKRSDVLNRECGLVVANDEYNGNTRSSIQRVISVRELG